MSREEARLLAREAISKGRPLDWFETLYAKAQGRADQIPWADLAPNPNLVNWPGLAEACPHGCRVLVVGCGLGDDAEFLAGKGAKVTAFDLSPTAIAWAQKRFPGSPVEYLAADLLRPLAAWTRAFDFVFEAYTLQVLPPDLRSQALEILPAFLKAGGRLLIVSRGREPSEPKGEMPWPLTKGEIMGALEAKGHVESFEDYRDQEEPPQRRLRILLGAASLEES